MRHIYYYYRTAEGGMEIPACEEFTGLRDNAVRALAAKFRGSVTPITRILGEFSSPGDAANFAAALEAQFACTPKGETGLRYSLLYQVLPALRLEYGLGGAARLWV